MRKYLFVFLCALAMCAQAAVNEKPFVVPEIQQWKGAEGTFSLVSSTTVTFNDAALEPVAQYLVQGVSLGTKAQEGKRKPNGIHIQIEKNKKLGAEGFIATLAEKYGVANTAITDFADQK